MLNWRKAIIAGRSLATFWLSWTEVGDLGSHIFGQTSIKGCAKFTPVNILTIWTNHNFLTSMSDNMFMLLS